MLATAHFRVIGLPSSTPLKNTPILDSRRKLIVPITQNNVFEKVNLWPQCVLHHPSKAFKIACFWMMLGCFCCYICKGGRGGNIVTFNSPKRQLMIVESWSLDTSENQHFFQKTVLKFVLRKFMDLPKKIFFSLKKESSWEAGTGMNSLTNEFHLRKSGFNIGVWKEWLSRDEKQHLPNWCDDQITPHSSSRNPGSGKGLGLPRPNLSQPIWWPPTAMSECSVWL